MNIESLKSKLPRREWWAKGPLTDEEACKAGGTPPEIVVVDCEGTEEEPAECSSIAEFDNEKDRDAAVFWANLAPELIAVVERAQVLVATEVRERRGVHIGPLDSALESLGSKLAQQEKA